MFMVAVAAGKSKIGVDRIYRMDLEDLRDPIGCGVKDQQASI